MSIDTDEDIRPPSDQRRSKSVFRLSEGSALMAVMQTAGKLKSLMLGAVRSLDRGPTAPAFRAVRSARDDRIVGLAAQVAFFALLSLPPGVLILAGLAGFVGDLFGPEVRRSIEMEIFSLLGSFLRAETMESVVRPAISGLFEKGRVGVVTIGGLVAAWAASRAVTVTIESLNIAYDLKETRAGWNRRLLALGITLAMAASLSLFLPLLVAGPRVAEIIGSAAGLEQTTLLAWRLAYWPIIAAAALTILAAFYKIAPAHKPRFRDQIPGALLGGGLWLLSALALRVYVDFALSEATFGPLAAPAALLLWLYITALAVLAGGELNAELRRSRPADKNPGKATTRR